MLDESKEHSAVSLCLVLPIGKHDLQRPCCPGADYVCNPQTNACCLRAPFAATPAATLIQSASIALQASAAIARTRAAPSAATQAKAARTPITARAAHAATAQAPGRCVAWVNAARLR